VTAAVRPLIVAGAGPAGLTTSLAAAALGVPVTVVEREREDRERPGSRALYVHRDSLRLLERASPGLGRTIAESGIVWRRRVTTFRGRTVYSHDTPERTVEDLPPYTCLRQVDTERLLLRACRTAGVDVVWGAGVRAIDVEPSGVVVHGLDGRSRAGAYLVGADGARSAVRTSLGTPLVGARSSSYHVVVDLADDPDRPGPADRVFHYHHPGLGGRHVLVVPFAGGRQVDLQCRPDDDPVEMASTAGVRRWLPAVLDDAYLARILWTASYPFLQRVAESLVDAHRRVLLVGEAGHLFAPFGARGMNSGIADGDAAATAIATALGATNPGRARGAVEDFDRARLRAAERNRRAAAAALAHMRPARRVTRVRQVAAAALAPAVPRLGSWLEHAPYGPRTVAPGPSEGRY